MSGPPYPHPNPAPGSNAIGSFVIGVSPIGTISPFDFWQLILSQYANSPTLTGLIESINDALDQTGNMESFYDLVWNLPTAQGWGLDVLGRIVGVVRTVNIPGGGEYFGFQEPGSWGGFGDSGGFYSGGGISDNIVLSDADFRILITAKAAGNISDGSIKSMNSILMTLFRNRGNAYVVDNQDMSIDLHFDFPLNQVELAIIQQPGILPTPVGVVTNIVQP
jgi:hypothetical protein